MNPAIDRLYPYPFEKLARLLSQVEPPAGSPVISMSIGEPKHPAPQFILDALTRAQKSGIGSYPVSLGLDELRNACAEWLARRFKLEVSPHSEILPVNGTREGLFSVAQTVIDSAKENPLVAMPNPFYQIYEGAAFLAGASALYLNTVEDHDFLPDLDSVSDSEWRAIQLFYVCSPGNPSGTVLDADFYRRLLALADKFDFVVAADECYTELYRSQPPLSLLQVCRDMGRNDYRRCLVFHSLSKRSNVPGLRSGFVAGDASLIKPFLAYRTYHGCAMPLMTQHASVAAWDEDAHVADNRAAYNEKYRQVVPILSKHLSVSTPEASFYLWPDVGSDDEQFVQQLYQHDGIIALPGSYLARDTANGNPGNGRVRISLVAPLDECVRAAHAINAFIESRS